MFPQNQSFLYECLLFDFKNLPLHSGDNKSVTPIIYTYDFL